MKERLTGAIILVALLVLLVPELLTGPGPSAASSHLPGADGAQMRSYTINLADDAATHGANSAPVVEAPAPMPKPADESTSGKANSAANEGADAQSGGTAEVEGGAAADGATAHPLDDGTPSPAPGAQTNASPAAKESKPKEAPTPSPSAAASDSKARQQAPAARAAGAATPPTSGWAVQVGSFASRENAERLAHELKGKGFAATVSQGSGPKRLWRVRVGPEADRAAAVALGAKLHSAGQSGAVVPFP